MKITNLKPILSLVLAALFITLSLQAVSALNRHIKERWAYGHLLITLSLNVASNFTVTIDEKGERKAYGCPPCGCGKDDAVYEQPGVCPVCEMALIEKGSQANHQASRPAQPPRKKVAILIFDGVQIIDYTGPFEVFGQAGFDVYTVSISTNKISTSMGMEVVPKYSLDQAPQADILVIPGGNVDRAQENPAIIKWIQGQSKDAEHVLSVCNGAFILAKTGLLDGLSATTFYGLIDNLVPVAPKTKIVRDQRYVDNGKIITTAGLSSGIDGSLYVISKVLGKGRAQMVALNMEYNWQPGSGYARASFADRHLRKIFSRGLVFATPQGVTLKVLSTDGNYEKWEINWQTEGQTLATDIARLLHDKLANEGKWTKQNEKTAKDITQSGWKFADENGEVWNAALEVKPAAKEINRLQVTLKINNTKKRETLSSASSKNIQSGKQ
jgi:putative intracellular protease/amidase